MKLKGKRIVLTGGTSGVGSELVERLADQNELVVLGRNASKLVNLKRRFPTVGTELCDLADGASTGVACLSLTERFTPFDVLICNAAVQHPARFTSVGFDSRMIEPEVTTNFTSICVLIGRLLPALRESGRPGKIVLVNSALALAPKTDSAVYCATKAALRSLGWSLEYQLAESPVSVTQVYLPLVDTPMTAGRGQGKISAKQAADEIIAGIESGARERFVGKARLIAWINRISPRVAREILRRQ